MAKKEFIERDSTLLKMWNALYALEDEQEKQNGIDIMRRSDVQAGFEAGQSAVVNEPAVDVVELNRDKLIELLSRYFSIGDSYTYELTRVKEAFETDTMTFDDFVEWNEDNVADLADWLIKELKGGD